MPGAAGRGRGRVRRRAATLLESILPRAGVLGGSAAQREVLEDTLVHALARSGQGDRAAAVLDERLSRPLARLHAGLDQRVDLRLSVDASRVRTTQPDADRIG